MKYNVGDKFTSEYNNSLEIISLHEECPVITGGVGYSEIQPIPIVNYFGVKYIVNCKKYEEILSTSQIFRIIDDYCLIKQ